MSKLLIIIVFFAFSMIRAVIKSANEKAEKERLLVERADPNRKQRVQGEIDAFLSEVSGGGQGKRPQRQGEPGQKSQERKQQAQRDRTEQQRQIKIQQTREATRVRRQAESQAATTPGRRGGSGISEHVDQYINQHVDQHIDHDIEEYVESSIVDSVDAHLGTRISQMPEQTKSSSRRRSNAAQSVVALLRDPAGVRNAILLNEILSKPPSLRK